MCLIGEKRKGYLEFYIIRSDLNSWNQMQQLRHVVFLELKLTLKLCWTGDMLNHTHTTSMAAENPEDV